MGKARHYKQLRRVSEELTIGKPQVKVTPTRHRSGGITLETVPHCTRNTYKRLKRIAKHGK